MKASKRVVASPTGAERPARPVRAASSTSAGAASAALERLAALAVLVGLLAPAVGAAAPPARSDGVTLVRIEGALDVGTLSLVRRAAAGARERDDRLVFELDTPGGEVELMWRVARAIGGASDEGIVTVAWVNDRALSAGALVAMACDRLYMRRRATIGSATAITVGPGGAMPVATDEAVREKFTSSFRSQFRAWAEEHGRSGAVAEAMVDADVEVYQVRVDGELRILTGKERDDLYEKGEPVRLVRTVVEQGELLNLTGAEALELQFVDGLAESRAEVLDRIGSSGVEPTVVERARSEELAAWLSSLAPLLFIGGLVLAFVELKVPGFGLPGILSVACFALLLFGRYLVGLADVPHFVLVAVGLALLAVEVFVVPGTLWAGVLGGVCLIGGLVWANVGTHGFDHPLDRELAVDGAFDVVAWSFLAVLVMWGLSRVLPRTSAFGRLVLQPSDAMGGDPRGAGGAASGRGERGRGAGLAGRSGTVLTALRPVGKVAVDGDPEQYEARYPSGTLEAGERVKVIEVGPSGRLLVEPAPESPPARTAP